MFFNLKISPGDFVHFDLSSEVNTIWKTYLAPGILKDERGEIIWHEIKSGDIGIVIDTSRQEFGTVSVLISRINCILKIHTKRLKTIVRQQGSFHP